jgi:hypothetical protein
MGTNATKQRPSLTEVVPALHQWLAKQNRQSFGIFHSIIIERLCDQHFADKALARSKEGFDKETIELAAMIAALSAMQRRKLSYIWHFYEPDSKEVPPTKSASQKLDLIRQS